MNWLEILNRLWELLARRVDAFLFAVAMTIVGVGLVTLFSAADQNLARVWSQGGNLALALVIVQVRTLPGAAELLVSWVPEPGGPEPFYRGLGFEPTGEIDEDEVVARLRL